MHTAATSRVASGFKRLIFLSGNGPNAPPLESARLQLRYEFPKCRFRVVSLFDASARLATAYTRDGSFQLDATGNIDMARVARLPNLSARIPPIEQETV